MRMRSRRRGVLAWSPSGPAVRYGVPTLTRLTRPGRIRFWFRTGALLTVMGVTWLARTVRARWRPVFLVTGSLLAVVGFILPVGWAFVSGLLVLLFALLRGAEPGHCRAAAHLAGARWRG